MAGEGDFIFKKTGFSPEHFFYPGTRVRLYRSGDANALPGQQKKIAGNYLAERLPPQVRV